MRKRGSKKVRKTDGEKGRKEGRMYGKRME